MNGYAQDERIFDMASNSSLKFAETSVRVERSEAKSKYELRSITYLARFDFAPTALRSARTENFNELLI